MFKTVHLVFENEHLLNRDKSDFQDFWDLLQYGEDKIQYHVGCGFIPSPDELIIVDEADTFMLDNPESFSTFIQSCCCICFTATPGGCAPQEAENKVISALKFERFEYLKVELKNAMGVAVSLADLPFDEILNAPSATEKATVIKELSRSGPVLIFCDKDLTAEIK